MNKPNSIEELLASTKVVLQASSNYVNYIKKLREWGLFSSVGPSGTGLGLSIELTLGYCEMTVAKNENIISLVIGGKSGGCWGVVRDGKILASPQKMF